jgi:hypothetical protein
LFRANSYLDSLQSVFGSTDSDANVVVVRQPKSADQQPTSIKTLAGRGVIFLGCNLATRGLAMEMGKKTKQDDNASTRT